MCFRKSQIAIHYCYSYQVQYPQRHVFWIHAGSTTRIDEGYRNIARGLSLPGWREPATDIHQIVDDWLLSVDNGPWLLVVDSADDMSVFFATESGIPGTKLQPITILLRRVAQSSHGSLIITTRDKRLGRRLLNGSHPVEVPLMNDEDAKQLLRARGAGSSSTEVDTQALVRMLGFLPLAITQAAAFISENQTSVATYNEIFRCTNWRRAAVLGEDLTDPRRDPESMNSVLDTWKISFEQLAHQSPRAASFLSTMAVLSPGAVPSALLRRDGESLLEFTKAMGILKAFSLIDADDRETNYRMHDLVHLATQEWLESRGQRATYEEGALQVVADKFPSGESQQWDQCKKIYPHAGVVEHFDTLSASTSLQKARLKQKMANYLRAQDQYDQAMKRHEEAAEAFETERGTRDLETLNNMSDMGLTLTYQGNSTKGERLLRTAASGIEEIQGPQDLDTMNHLARLAENLLCQAKFSTAERIYRRVYTNRKAILGEGHLDTLLSLSYLGPPLEWLGRLEESEDVNKRAVGGMQRILPVHHAGLYLAEVKLGFILQKRGKLEEAESSARRSLENRLAIYGPGHKWVSWSTQTLSLTLRDQGRHEEALYHSKAVVQMREREFPANHILVIKAIYTLAFLYHGLQDYDQASIHYLDCLARAQMSYGLLHPLPVAIRAQYLRMIERTTDVELNWRTCVSPRAFWMTLSPKQFSILAHFAGVPDPQRHNRNMGVELFETYCFVLVTYARRMWHRVMHKVIVGLITLLVILCESMIFSWIDRRIPFSSYSG